MASQPMRLQSPSTRRRTFARIWQKLPASPQDVRLNTGSPCQSRRTVYASPLPHNPRIYCVGACGDSRFLLLVRGASEIIDGKLRQSCLSLCEDEKSRLLLTTPSSHVLAGLISGYSDGSISFSVYCSPSCIYKPMHGRSSLLFS